MFQFFCFIFNFCWLFKNKKKNVYFSFSFIHQFVCESAKILFLFLILKILFRIFFKNLNLVFIDNHFFRSYKTGKLKIKMLFFSCFIKITINLLIFIFITINKTIAFDFYFVYVSILSSSFSFFYF